MSECDQEDVRSVFYPVLILQDGLDVRVGDDHIVQLQLRRLTLGLHGTNQIHCGPVKQNRESRGSKAGLPTRPPGTPRVTVSLHFNWLG